jgi:hypothetical protein
VQAAASGGVRRLSRRNLGGRIREPGAAVLLIVFGVMFGIHLAMVHDVQQLAAEAARSSGCCGISDRISAAIAPSWAAAWCWSWAVPCSVAKPTSGSQGIRCDRAVLVN